ncbi:MAG TPA: glycosyltransferase family 2 protein [Vicinamibacteria bacterium]|nr:glycosyltransferase family 2 protein [Vicinamibacteria bacterium]
MTPRLSVVLSFRNEQEVLPELVGRLRAALDPMPGGYELVFVDDASTDESLSYLRGLAATDTHVRVLSTSRRFGVAECLRAGLEHARGEAAVYLDADLQDPPELIPRLVEQWEQGADVVYTVRTARLGEAAWKRWLTRQAYRLIRAAADIDLPVEAGDYRLLSRRVVRELLALREARPYMRGLVSWVGFRQVGVPYTRSARAAGEGHFPVFRSRGPLMTLFTGLTSFSLLPLVAVFLAGIGLLGLGGAGLGLAGAMRLLGRAVPAAAWLGSMMIALTGAQLTGVGVVGLYVARVYDDVRGRPQAIIASRIGFEP